MNDDFGTRLGAALREDSPEPRSHLGLDDVAPVARRLRTRRRAGIGAAVLGVVLAAAVPIGISALQGPESDPLPPAKSGPKNDQKPDTTPDEPREPTVLTLSADTPIDPSSSGEWVTPTQPVSGPDADWDDAPWMSEATQFVRLGDTLLVVSADTDANLTAHLVVEGAEAWSSPVVGAAVHDADDSAALLTTDGDLVVLADDGTRRTFADGLPGTTRLGAVHASRDCVRTGLALPCYVVVSDDATPALPTVINADGTTRDVTGAPKAVTARFGGAGSLLTVTDDFSVEAPACSTVLDVYGDSTGEGDRTMWRSCTVTATDFSPSGTTAVVMDAEGDGIGPARLGLADGETGKVHTWLEPEGQGFVGHVVWVSDRLLEVSSYSWETRTWRIHSVDVDAARVVSQVMAPAEGEDVDFPFVPVER